MDLSLSDFISQYQGRIEVCLDQHLTQLTGHSTSLMDAMRYSTLEGGKRMRPLLAYAAAAACGNISTITDDFACAIEFVHVYSLIHDDLPAMDDDELRRGKATCHIAFNEATAILAGDALQGKAYEVLTASKADDAIKVAAMTALSKAAGASGMVLGQAIDLESVDKRLSLQQLEIMHRHKTGALIEASVVLGALSGGASPQQLTALKTYAQAIGLAFQVQDDILDVTSNTQTLGKTQGADQLRNKPTYVSLMGLDDAITRAQSLKAQAIEALDIFDAQATMLSLLAEYIVNRNY